MVTKIGTIGGKKKFVDRNSSFIQDIPKWLEIFKSIVIFYGKLLILVFYIIPFYNYTNTIMRLNF